MNKLQQEFYEWQASWERYLSRESTDNYDEVDVSHVWKAVYDKQTLPYIDLLKDIYYNHDLPNGVDQKIEKLLGDLL